MSQKSIGGSNADMVFGKLLQPDLVLGTSVLGITPDLLRRHGLDGIVLDVDETLVPIRVAQASDELTVWLSELKPHASIWLVSNNSSESRISRIANALDLPYLKGAFKPSRRKLRQAIEAMDLSAERVGMVGDRLMTDVLAGNRLGMFTILVEPIVNPAEAVRKHPIRNAEVWISRRLGVTLQSPP